MWVFWLQMCKQQQNTDMYYIIKRRMIQEKSVNTACLLLIRSKKNEMIHSPSLQINAFGKFKFIIIIVGNAIQTKWFSLPQISLCSFMIIQKKTIG